MMYFKLLQLTNNLNFNNRNCLRLFFRKYASCGIMRWDMPIDTKIKLEIEDYWRDKVAALNSNRTNNEAEKYYVLSMFPYPSGSLHMGHVRVYTLSDTLARYYRMNDKYVIHPIGWDAFGLPAENAAIERNINPVIWTQQNIAQMRKQLQALGCSFDWDREIATCDPSYYKWTQDLFLKLYEKGLVYKQYDYVNWDPVDQTVLAAEQVTDNGLSWRSGAKVEKKLLNQWFIKTTAFAESLLKGLDDPILKEWRDIIKIQQHWIGECNGSNFRFQLISNNGNDYPKSMDLWTKNPEFIKEAKCVTVSHNSMLYKKKFSEKKNVSSIKIPDISFMNPFTNEIIPVFLTDEVEFPAGNEEYLVIPRASEKDAAFCQAVGIEFDNSEVISENDRISQRNKIMAEARERNLGGYLVSSHLKDWLISRQRFWGTPIPIINCEKCGDQMVPREQLPVMLPECAELSKEERTTYMEKWKKVNCPKCEGPANREIDTMDTFVDSSWYYIRYLDSKNKNEMVDKEKADNLLPVDLYIGGKEHALLHLYFARFINHFLHSVGLVPTREPFKQLLVIGFVMGKTFKLTKTGKFVKSSDVEEVNGQLVEKSSGLPVKSYWDKMSKSKYNGVDPVEMFSKYSLDTIRLIIMSDSNPVSQRNWSTESFEIILNWENKLWLLLRQFIKIRNSFSNGELQINENDIEKDNVEICRERNYHIERVCYNIIGTQQLNNAISKLHSMTKRLRKASPSAFAKSHEFERMLAAQIIMIAPLAPHFASELWAGFCSAPGRLINDSEISWDKDVLEQKWPEIDLDFPLKLFCKINNHIIATIPVKRRDLQSATLQDLIIIAENYPKVKKHLEGWNIIEANSYSACDIDVFLNLTTRRKINEELQIASK